MSRLFDRGINVRGRRPSGVTVSVTLRACVMDGSFDEPMSDDATATSRHRQTFVFKIADWTEVEPPQIGDIVTDEDGCRYAVARVEKFFGREFVIDGRSVK